MKKFFLLVLLGIAGFTITAIVGGGILALLTIRSIAVVVNHVFFAFLALAFFYMLGWMIYDMITSWMVWQRMLRKIKDEDEAKD